MDVCKVGVGGCGGELYKTFLGHADKLVGPVLRYTLPFTDSPRYPAQHILKKPYEEAKGEWEPLFNGLHLDLDENDLRGLKKIEERTDDDVYNQTYYYKYNEGDILTNDLVDKMVNRLGYQMDGPGFIHRPELQMIAFGDPEINEAICKTIYEKIKRIAFDSLFFFVGLGGGTGTGVIGNLNEYITQKKGTMKGSFVLGVLTGKNDDRLGMLTKKEDDDQKKDEQSPKKANSESIRTQAGFHRRTFNAMWALSDLLAGKKVDCVILVDNDKLSEIEEVEKEIGKRKEEGAGAVVDRYIIRSIFPLLGGNEIGQIDESGLKQIMRRSTFRPIFVPCYWHGKMDLENLIKNAVTEGKLADCNHTTATNATVITKGFMDDEDTIKEIVKRGLQKAGVNVKTPGVGRTRKVGGADPKEKEVLILLQNPGLEDLLSERIEAAINFIELTEIIYRIESTMRPKINEDTRSDEKKLSAHFEALIKEDDRGRKLLDELKDTIKTYNPKKSEEELITLIVNAWDLLHAKDEFHFTEDVVQEEWRFLKDFKEELLKVKKRIVKIDNGDRELFKKHVSIKLGCLASIQSRCLFSWDNSWRIEDSLPGGYLGNVDNAQIIYHLDENERKELYTIKCNGDELATFERWKGSKKAKLKTNIDDKIFDLILDRDSNKVYEAQFEEELNNRVISRELKEELQKGENKLSLSDTVTVAPLTTDKKWRIQDEKHTYLIFAEKEELNFYEYPEEWLSQSSTDERISELNETLEQHNTEIEKIKQQLDQLGGTDFSAQNLK